ncbi:lysine 2,3-aminomutase [Candidatus Kryptonium thompsonii]|uniref:Lysine 2,3-aminomutase n=1 Tax=Candidatus Kryptonium thompsonii TaxID=1633631 RepID=A0A0P1LUL6_9BACT|nr:KamA family radical SAM protein [Candidatus Kryptonium thompsoni]CUS78487.1 lysine 2,3-aminomutase [Candidatus Kryptonium thompsoni]CUS79750.1 lysine 2,3-aminomutase [Candidatus Kryptonium thompsoni]CUS83868.1 lysine 2,3-aminomutase [Candidatus Kryptonium thompsoni]CUS84605.1 lysine 2,3-aminomutase [Candidatus Kryptonium thompsoni]CUS85058.1 lysine 2,3-aminomutase [Candidatus Kryptonium thompsoni]
MELWQELLRKSLETAEDFAEVFGVDKDLMRRISEKYPVRINPYYLSLIRYKGDPIWLQCFPSPEELADEEMPEDPLDEDAMSPVPSITHRYPDRVLFLVTSQCSMYCRFCTRKRKVGDSSKISMKFIQDGIEYIRNHPEVRDVILSGGDPLMLTDYMLEKIIKALREIPHVEIIRIGTKMPCVLPQRITENLCNMLKKYHPIYVNTHFNHPWEITPESKRACEMLADAGIPVGNQTVLLRGVNDDPYVMQDLMKKLLAIRVRPYYIYQADITRGANHFRTPIKVGIEIMDKLRGHISGLAVPYYVIDAPGGGGKIPILPHYVIAHNESEIILRNFRYEIYVYPDVKEDEIEEIVYEPKPTAEPRKIVERKKWLVE